MPRITRLSVVGLLCLGAIATMASSIDDAPPLEPVLNLDDHSLSPEEHAYVTFMVPRIDRLIDEGSAVSSLVAERSRDLIALGSRGSRINTLSTEITEWSSSHSVPDRFRGTHGSLVRAAAELSSLIDQARTAFMRLDFNGMDDLTTRFNSAVATVITVRDFLPVPIDEPS